MGSTHDDRSPRFLTELSVCAAPNHPGKPAGCTCSLLHRQRRTAHPPGGKPLPNERNEADSGSLALRPTPSTPAQGRRPPHGGPPRPPRGGHPRPRPGGLHVVRAIHMVNTSQLTSSAKLGLAFQRLRGTEGGAEGEVAGRAPDAPPKRYLNGVFCDREQRRLRLRDGRDPRRPDGDKIRFKTAIPPLRDPLCLCASVPSTAPSLPFPPSPVPTATPLSRSWATLPR